MDNYKLSNYINHSLSLFPKKLDEFNGDENYASAILDLIEIQFQEHQSTDLEIEPEEYYPIYDYLCDMYFKKYITKDMTQQEMETITDTLVNKIIQNVPDDYNIDIERFYDNFETYKTKNHSNTL